mmetsp:Transcript_81248/g.178603  ORF Transcript_81248/g.178603 Transcript_81248/m.178603 type:complete len:85 (-) Transcript_81248:60-314(-)
MLSELLLTVRQELVNLDLSEFPATGDTSSGIVAGLRRTSPGSFSESTGDVGDEFVAGGEPALRRIIEGPTTALRLPVLRDAGVD